MKDEMSISYSISVELDANCSHQNISFIFKRGSELGFIYYVKSPEPSDGYHSISASDQAAAEFIFKKIEHGTYDDGENYFMTKFQDTDFLLTLYPKNNNLRVSFVDIGEPWMRVIDYKSRTIDFARYSRLILDLCKDFSILKLETFAG
jgi:hypothetical protein